MSEESTMAGSGQNPWMDAFKRQQDTQRMADEAERAARMEGEANENGMFFNDLVQTHLRNRENQRKRNRRGAAALLSAFKIGAYNGGDLPDDLLPAMGDALGYDGKTRQLGRVHVNEQGDVTLFTSRTDPQSGSVVEDKPTVIPFKNVYGTALENPGILTRDEMMLLRNGSKNYQKLTEDMANRELPPVPDDYGKFRTPVGERTPEGGISVPGWWLYGPQRRANISAFGANGRGGFTNYDSNEDTGYQLQVRDSGTRAGDDKGRWKVLSRGAAPGMDDGTQVTRYENDKTGEVVFVRDGETPPWESRAGGERERIARMNNETRERVQQQRGAAQRDVAQVTADATKHKADASVEVAAQNGRTKTARGGGRSDGDSSASLRRILDKSSGATDEERRKTIAMLQAREERRDRELAMSDKDRALKKADDIIDLYGGDMSGFPIKDREQIRNVVAGELYAGKEYDPDEWGSYFDNLRAQRAKNAAQNVGKAEVKTGDNGGGNGRQFKEGDVQEINGIKMKLLPSKKNPGKLTWQRV